MRDCRTSRPGRIACSCSGEPATSNTVASLTPRRRLLAGMLGYCQLTCHPRQSASCIQRAGWEPAGCHPRKPPPSHYRHLASEKCVRSFPPIRRCPVSLGAPRTQQYRRRAPKRWFNWLSLPPSSASPCRIRLTLDTAAVVRSIELGTSCRESWSPLRACVLRSGQCGCPSRCPQPSSATRDTGHHSRFVQGVCFLPALERMAHAFSISSPTSSTS